MISKKVAQDIKYYKVISKKVAQDIKYYTVGQRSFSYQAPSVWNQLPVSVHHLSVLFEASLKTFLLSKTVFSVPLT